MKEEFGRFIRDHFREKMIGDDSAKSYYDDYDDFTVAGLRSRIDDLLYDQCFKDY